MRGCPRTYPWQQRPKDDEAMRRKIARCLGTSVHGSITVKDRRGAQVRVTVDDVQKHNWQLHRERWAEVPLIKPAIRSAYRRGPGKYPGRDMYSACLEFVRGAGAPIKRHIAIHVEGSRLLKGNLKWISAHEIGVNQLRNWEEEGGPAYWEAPMNAELRNPAPARPHPRVSRPGRTLKAYKYHNPSISPQSRIGGLVLILGGLCVLGRLTNQLARIV